MNEEDLLEEIDLLRKALKPFAFLDSKTTQEAWELRYQDRFGDWIDFDDIKNARNLILKRYE